MAKIEQVKNKKHEIIHPITEVVAVEGLPEALAEKQETLVSGENIRKINGESILGSGEIKITGSGPGSTIVIDGEMSTESENPVQNKVITQALNTKQDELQDGVNIKTINGEPVLGSGDLFIQEGDPSAVKFSPQELTELQKEQARRNINAASLADLNSMSFVTAQTLPEASSETMGYIFLIGPDGHNFYDRYFTQETVEDEVSTYEWIPLGSTQIDLTTYAPQSEVDELADRLDTLASTRYYGIFTSESLLPETASRVGYAYVGESEPFKIYEFNGENWNYTGAQVSGIKGEPGLGFDSISSQEDGTIVIVLSNGNTITIDINHDHPQYPKYTLLDDESEMPASPDSETLYLIKELPD